MFRQGNMTDSMILTILRSDDAPDDAIRQLYRSQFNTVSNYVKTNKGSVQDAEDIFQETVLNFIEMVKAGKFRAESSIGTFLYAIAKNIWLNELKKRQRSQLREEKFESNRDTTEKDISNHLIHRESKAALFRLMDNLGENCKKILLAFYYENLAIRDILQKMEYENEQVIRNKKYKCLKQLEQMIAANSSLAQNLQSILYE